MRDLIITEFSIVSGAFKPPEAHPGMDVRVALTSLGGRTAVGGAFMAGYKAGQWLNENTPVQKWIRNGIDKIQNNHQDTDA